LDGVLDRRAYFKCVVAFMKNSSTKPLLFKGIASGTIADTIRGRSGFGFDPIFIPNGLCRTFAEMKIEEKNLVSHRSKAFLTFWNWFSSKQFARYH
jgi:XTP/dITP diphosphohydrolase